MFWLPLILWGMLVLACLPAFLRLVMPPLPLDDAAEAPACVVVLGAGCRRDSDGTVGLSARSLARLEAGLSLAKRESLPLLVSGGALFAGKGGGMTPSSEAGLMANLLAEHHPLQVVWQENISRNTHENARLCSKLLCRKRINRIYLVTDQSHLCRALLSFNKQGMSCYPHASSLFPRPAWMPHAGALMLWPEIIYEWLALTMYALRRWV